MDSMGEADMIIVTDTGSEDATPQKLRERGAIVYVEEIKPWRFDIARNVSLEHIPQDIDICVCTDLDEVFEKGWRQCLERAWTDDAKTGKYLYNWSLKDDGTPYVQLYYSKIHARQGFQWNYPVHEWLCYTGSEPQVTVFIDGMVLNHHPDPSKSRSSYLPLLELAAKEDPEGDRVCYYLGREYMYAGQWDKCIAELKRHLLLPRAVWSEERCASMRWIAHSYYKKGDVQEACRWYFRAIAEAPHMRDAYIECAKMAYQQKDWPMVHFMVEEALKIKEKSRSYVNMGYSWDYTPNDLGAIACYWLGMYQRSLEHAKSALDLSPEDARLKSNLSLIENKLSEIDSKKTSSE